MSSAGRYDDQILRCRVPCRSAERRGGSARVAPFPLAQIAGILALSPKTIETYRRRLMHKLGLSGLPSLVKFAIQHGLTPPE
jgi:FixJ family two-component response regulator